MGVTEKGLRSASVRLRSKCVFDENARDARFFAAPVREPLADLLGVAVGALGEFLREARLPRFLPRLHAALLPRLLGVLERDVELHFLDARRRGHSRAERDPRRALLGARLLRSFGFAGPDDDARRRSFLSLRQEMRS